MLLSIVTFKLSGLVGAVLSVAAMELVAGGVIVFFMGAGLGAVGVEFGLGVGDGVEAGGVGGGAGSGQPLLLAGPA